MCQQNILSFLIGFTSVAFGLFILGFFRKIDIKPLKLKFFVVLFPIILAAIVQLLVIVESCM